MLTARRAQRKEYAPVQAELSSEIFTINVDILYSQLRSQPNHVSIDAAGGCWSWH